MKTAREFALNKMKSFVVHGWTLDLVLKSHEGGGGPCINKDTPVYSYGMNGAHLFFFREGAKHVTVKRGQIGVVLEWQDGSGREDFGIFSIRELWKEVTDPKPVQLSLFDEVQA